MTMFKCLKDGYGKLLLRLESVLAPTALLLLRLVPAQVFLSSGLTKWNGWFDFNEQKIDLFLYELFCPEEPRPGALLLCNPDTLDYAPGSGVVTMIEIMAISAGVLEVVLPVLLILGLFTRFAALGLIGMTLFIQFAVFPGWTHWWNPAIWWFSTLFAVLAMGAGKLSLDRWFRLDHDAFRTM